MVAKILASSAGFLTIEHRTSGETLSLVRIAIAVSIVKHSGTVPSLTVYVEEVVLMRNYIKAQLSGLQSTFKNIVHALRNR